MKPGESLVEVRKGLDVQFSPLTRDKGPKANLVWSLLVPTEADPSLVWMDVADAVEHQWEAKGPKGPSLLLNSECVGARELRRRVYVG